VAIIALLIAILLPLLSRARHQAQTVTCLSNLRQMGSAYQMYVNANKGRSIQFSFQTGFLVLEDVLLPDRSKGVQSPVVFCPEAAEPGMRVREPGDEHYFYPGSTHRPWGFPDSLVWSEHALSPFRGSSYGMNGWLYTYPAGFPHAMGEWEFIRLPAQESDRVPLLADATFSYGQPRPTDVPPASLNPHTIREPSAYAMGRIFCIPRHGRRINVVFLDGHARTVPLEELWQLKWHIAWTPATVTLPAK
jgi:prepilin-type processing-associated H-X9-DG protein